MEKFSTTEPGLFYEDRTFFWIGSLMVEFGRANWSQTTGNCFFLVFSGSGSSFLSCLFKTVMLLACGLKNG